MQSFPYALSHESCLKKSCESQRWARRSAFTNERPPLYFSLMVLSQMGGGTTDEKNKDEPTASKEKAECRERHSAL